MRTTVTLDPDASRQPFRTATANLGTSTVDLDRALALAGDIHDDELIRRLRTHDARAT